MKAFHFIICLSTFDLLSITNALSKTLQDTKLDLAAASKLVDGTIATLNQYRLEAKWSGVWQESVLLARCAQYQNVQEGLMIMWGQLLVDPVTIYHRG